MVGAEGRTDSASRLIKASAEKIYRAFVDPDAWVRWLPPHGMTGEMHHFDPRPGGTYRMTLNYNGAGAGKSSAETDVVKGTFVEFVPNDRVVQKVEFESNDPAFAGTMTMSWSLAAAEDGTEVTITAENVPPRISKDDHDAGLRSTLENLAAFVE